MSRLMKKGIFAAVLMAFSVLHPAGDVWADGPYRGKVIDAETKEPLEGAVVLGVWRRRVFSFMHSKYVFDEAKEVLTDKNGEFALPGHTNIPSITDPLLPFEIRIFIYKPGYGSFPRYQVSPPRQSYSTLLKLFETHVLVELPRLKTRQERLRVQDCPAGDIPEEKLRNWLRLMNMENKNLGLEGTIRCFVEDFE